MKRCIVLLIFVIFLEGCAANVKAPPLASTKNVAIIDQRSFDCTNEDKWGVTIGEVYGYSEHNENNPVVLLKSGFVFKKIDRYQEAYSFGYSEVWYLIQSQVLTQTVWINAKKAEISSLPCAPLFTK